MLHKDLKPANVLVMPAAGGTDAPAAAGWQIRLADFGSGRLLDREQLDRLRITQLGLTLEAGDSSSGTPYYIAPELLADGTPGPASDVFALGVMLYQMLAGDLRRPLAPGWERDLDDELLREDVALATDIDPHRRLASASALALRLRRLEERRAERQAETSRSELEAQRLATEALARQNEVATALNRLLREDLIGAANPALQGRADITVAEALTGAAERIDTKFANLPPAVRGSLHAAMQSALGELSRSQESVVAGRRAVAALAQAAATASPRSGPAWQETTAALQNARLRLALELVQLSELEEAGQVVAALDAAAAEDTAPTPVFMARLLFVKSWLTGGELAPEQSLGQLEQAWSLVHHLDEEHAPGRTPIMFALADSLALLGRHDEAEHLYRRLLREQVERFGADHIRPSYTLVGLGNVLARQGRHGEAQRLLQQAAKGLEAGLGAQHRQTLTALDMLADLRFRQTDYAAAAADWARVHTGYAALMGEGSSYTLTVQTSRAMALRRGGDPAAAEPLLRGALGHARAFLKDDAPQVQQIRFELADCLLDLKRVDEAAPLANGFTPDALNLAQPETDWPARIARLKAWLADG